MSDKLRHVEAALDNMCQGLCMFDDEARLLVCNRRYREIFDLAEDEVALGMSQSDLCAALIERGAYPPGTSVETVIEHTRAALRRNDGIPILRALADGRMLSVQYRRLDGGGWVSTFEDVTEHRRTEARAAHLAGHDALTDLVNARTLRHAPHRLLGAFDRDRPVLAAFQLDILRFKAINDTYGHAAGDEVLRMVADRLRQATRSDDVVARLGGDEFAILRRVENDVAAMSFAEHLRLTLSRSFDLGADRVEVGACVGVALREGIVGDVEPLLREADLALRCAKSEDRGEVRVFDVAMADSAQMRRDLELELRQALVRSEFELHYQPLVEIDTKRIVAAEALIRWRHPERGLVPPATFIPLAEEVGLIVPIGDWVVRQACADATRWPDHIVVAVNVSSLQMRRKGFAELVLRTLSVTGLPPERLELELTESALLEDDDTTLRNLAGLREAGVRFAIDDFGTGYASLSYLRRFPIDKIKIDRSFVTDAETSADALAIIRAVAGLGTSLGMTTVVEGVETEQQLDLARGEGVDQVQGYLISRPVPEDGFSSLVSKDPG
ncbi:putative bifunctional diguanylate cyclase/phosphodiesterase [Antarcticirhabdus aurantiaca]|uniref:EAL domain-containing protein n=1 Tax=Antarcticirhabdus aurantiaca TaxID=2606717 RepID=A0ACD4NKC3_9HYPH|nr:GGDEF domain-containing phosphodiesterase [Antarcticirhabdus aurantiaca]WAJ27091.1 EAL domain-containing protein [Jeongeuplla avenae]